MKEFISCLIILLFAVACNSTQPTPPSLTENRPPLIINEIAGTDISEDTLANLRIGENVKAYSLGRIVDAADSSLMHEGGIIYRIESSSSWNQQPKLPSRLPFAGTPPVIIGDDADLLRAEIEVKANEQRLLYGYIKKAADQATERIDVLSESVDIGQKLVQQNRILQQKLQKSQKNNQKLQKALLNLQDKLKTLLQFHQKKEKEKIHSQFRRK
jgi:hypothetical protein